jgi:NOL1/NOP2/sun family putative RNA methylase
MEQFKKHLSSYLNEKEIDELISSFSKPRYYGLLLNEEKMSKEKFLSLFPKCEPHPIVSNGFLYKKEDYEFGKHIFHELGVYYLQEPSAMVVSYLLNPKEDEVILDLCAAPGGKSIGASLLMKNKGLIISNDLSRERTSILKENIQRMGRSNLIVTNNDFSYTYKNFLNCFDKIILDAPCSGSGMFRKDEKMIEDWSINKVFKNALIQMQLISYSYQMLKPGGTLIYSTCSYSYEEDEAVIKHLLSITDAEILSLDNIEGFFQGKEKIGYHLFPNKFKGEGHYFCLIKKPGLLNKSNNKVKPHNNKFLNFKSIKNYEVNNFNNVLFALPFLIPYKGLNIILYGLKIGEVFKNNIRYSNHFAHFLPNDEKGIELSKEQAIKYIEGNELELNQNLNGYFIIKYQGIAIDFTKINSGRVKNHYPKNLRKTLSYL